MIGPKRWSVVAGLVLIGLAVAGCAAERASLSGNDAASGPREWNAETIPRFEQSWQSAEYAESRWNEERREAFASRPLATDGGIYQVGYEQAVVPGASASAAFIPPAPTENAGYAEPIGFAKPIDVEAPPTMATPGDALQQGCQAIAEGNAEAAVACFHRAMADKPDDPQIPIAAAIAALRSNHPQAAIDVLEPAARQFPRSAVIQRILGAAHYRRGDYRSAQAVLQQALSLDKSNALSYFLLGCTQTKLGATEAAERCFRQAQLLDPKFTVQPGVPTYVPKSFTDAHCFTDGEGWTGRAHDRLEGKD